MPERPDDEALVRQDRLPRQRPDQVGDEERADDEEQQHVLPAAAAERDPVRERVADQQREDRRDAGIFERADELGVVVAKRVRVVVPGPVERIAEPEGVAGLERLVPEEPERGDEEQREPRQARREQEVRRQPAMPVEEGHVDLLARIGRAHAPNTRCHFCR